MGRSLFYFLILICGSLSAGPHFVALSGSTRGGSYNTALLVEAADIARQQGAEVTIVDLSEYTMPFYDADVETVKGVPRLAAELSEMIAKSDGLIIASPEYNGSVSGVLKNAIDWTSREGRLYKGIPVAIMSASPGSHGGVAGLVHLRQILAHMGAHVVSEEVSIPKAYAAFDEEGHLTEASQQEALFLEISQLLRKD